jgi:hypothetical protein
MRQGVTMNIFYVVIGLAVLVPLTATLVVFAARRGWLRFFGPRTGKHRVPRRLWRRGGKYNYMELFEQPDGGLLYHVHRAYEVKCPRCLEPNVSGWRWTLAHKDGVDPLPGIGSPRMTFRCSRCGDVHGFAPQLGPSEWSENADKPDKSN